MNEIEIIEVNSRFQAIEMTLSLLLACSVAGRPEMLGRMHETLQGLLSDAVKNVSATAPGSSHAELGARLEALSGQNLDRIFSAAKAIR